MNALFFAGTRFGRVTKNSWDDDPMSTEQIPGCSFYIGNYTTQLYGYYTKPIQGSLLNKQYFMESKAGFFSWCWWDWTCFLFDVGLLPNKVILSLEI